ncbi:MAG: hypothetical protein FWG46_08180 [Treponema sp.]|nr:hypothetical protein [Treponema sp.]
MDTFEKMGKKADEFLEAAGQKGKELYGKAAQKTSEAARKASESAKAAADDAAAGAFIKEQAEKNAVKLGDLMMPLRVALTGSRVSPPLFGSLRLLGEERSLQRIDRALALLEG